MVGSSLQRWRALFWLFFASGISGLIYESIWSRYIKQLVGSAATAQILVLSLFMGGMSLGALFAGQTMRRVQRPVVAYGLIEGLIGLYALAFPHLFEWTMRLAYDVVFPALGHGQPIELAKWGLATLLVLPPCALLGMTFPLMSVGILRRERSRGGEVLALLYFSNSFGAAIGAILSGFALVPTVGLPGALMVAAGLNVLIMIVAVQDRAISAPILGRDIGHVATQPSTMVVLYLAVAFGTGLSSFMYEIGWIRLLSMILGSATHSFEVMLSAFVFGLALGGLWVRKRMDRFKRPEMTLAIVQLVMGISAIATLPAYLVAVQTMGWMMAGPERELFDWYAFNVLRYALCLLIMLPATFCAGMTLPLLTHVMLKRGRPESAIGNVYGINTLGAIAGAVMAGLVLMPLIGLKGVIVLGALVDLLLGLALVRSEIVFGRGNALTPKFLRRAALGTVFVTISGLLFPIDPTVLTSTVFRNGRTALPDAYDILSYVDGRTASVTVAENKEHLGYRIIYTNGKPDASVVLDRWPEGRDRDSGPDIAGDEPNQFLVGLLPLMVIPEATEGALIGFGSGVTCHTILGSPTLERLDTIEIEPEMVRGSKFFFPVNQRAYDDPRSHIWFDDAKAFFAASGRQYDFIISEPTNPWVSGVSSLFTVEFYRETKRYLKPGGVLAQWIQGYELSDDLLLSVLAAIDQEFEDYLIIRIGALDWVIVSRADGPIGPLSPAPLSWPDARDAFELLGIHDIGQIDGLIAANRQLLHPFLGDRVANRDAMPILDTGAERARFLRRSAEFLHSIRWTPAPILQVLGGLPIRAYPPEGIGDRRDPHILRESENAAYLMRRFERSDLPPPERISATPMDTYRDASRPIDGVWDWHTWIAATYEIYRVVAPHLAVTETSWWQDVRRIGARDDVPETVALSLELLDALAAQDGPRLWRAADTALAMPDFPLPQPLCAIAGLIALELTQASPTQRQEFAQQFMNASDGDASEDVAFRVLVAYAQRP